MSKEKIVFWTPNNMLRVCPTAKYFIAVGERSNGKTFGVKEYAFDDYLKRGKQLGVIRRWEDDFKGNNGKGFYNDFVNNPLRGNIIKTKSGGKWNSFKYTSGAWYLQRRNKDGEVEEEDEKPFALAFALTKTEHYKSIPFPDIETILFDEFMTRRLYINDEFLLFTDILSSIIRLRETPRIFMCANTISTYCPYMIEMGIRNFARMESGQIDIYEYGDNKQLKVCIERTDAMKKKGSKASNVFFAFDNPKLKMITEGSFEIAIYPHMPFQYIPKEIKYIYFIKFNYETFQCEIIHHEGNWITFIHRKTTPIKENEHNLIYQEEYDPRPNYARRILHPTNRLQNAIAKFFAKEKVFYQDNEVGESISHYLNWQDKA